eukprot:1183534-Prorocentrum_minimum.AAC.2
MALPACVWPGSVRAVPAIATGRAGMPARRGSGGGQEGVMRGSEGDTATVDRAYGCRDTYKYYINPLKHALLLHTGAGIRLEICDILPAPGATRFWKRSQRLYHPIPFGSLSQAVV